MHKELAIPLLDLLSCCSSTLKWQETCGIPGASLFISLLKFTRHDDSSVKSNAASCLVKMMTPHFLFDEQAVLVLVWIQTIMSFNDEHTQHIMSW